MCLWYLTKYVKALRVSRKDFFLDTLPFAKKNFRWGVPTNYLLQQFFPSLFQNWNPHIFENNGLGKLIIKSFQKQIALIVLWQIKEENIYGVDYWFVCVFVPFLSWSCCFWKPKLNVTLLLLCNLKVYRCNSVQERTIFTLSCTLEHLVFKIQKKNTLMKSA